MTTKTMLKSWFSHIRTPFIANAPMLGSTDAGLAAAVSKAGGFGFIGGGFDFSAESSQISALEAQLTRTRDILNIRDDRERLPIGVGFVTFKPSGFQHHVLPIIQKHRISAVWLAFPTSGPDHLPLITCIREARAKANWDIRVFVQIGDLKHAREAIEQGADVIVAQGSDAGGHQWAHGASVVSLVPEVRDLVRAAGKDGEVAVVAAGGIVDGRGLAAALALGADGVVMGTRFVCCEECPAPASIKEVMVSTTDGASSTIKSTSHDVFQSTDFWPSMYDGRAIIGESFKDFKAGMPDEENVAKYKAAMAVEDHGRRTVWAGSGVGIIQEILSAKDIMEKTQRDAKETISKLISLSDER